MGSVFSVIAGLISGCILFAALIFAFMFGKKPKTETSAAALSEKDKIIQDLRGEVTSLQQTLADTRAQAGGTQAELNLLAKENEALLTQLETAMSNRKDQMQSLSETETIMSMIEAENKDLKSLLNERKKAEDSAPRHPEPVASPPVKRVLFAEALVAAGPRKNDQLDIDPGEDVCGFLTKGNLFRFWLLDGTSDRPRFTVSRDGNEMEIFTSRQLALELSNELSALFSREQDTDMEQCLKTAVENCTKKWRALLNEYRKEFYEQFSGKRFINFSTTIVTGCLDIDQYRLTAIRTGDSMMTVLNSQGVVIPSSFSGKPVSDTGLDIVIRIILTSEDDIQLDTFPYTTERADLTDAATLFVYSDGIKAKISDYLNTNFTRGGIQGALDQIRTQRQNTHDDKAIIIAHITA